MSFYVSVLDATDTEFQFIDENALFRLECEIESTPSRGNFTAKKYPWLFWFEAVEIDACCRDGLKNGFAGAVLNWIFLEDCSRRIS